MLYQTLAMLGANKYTVEFEPKGTGGEVRQWQCTIRRAGDNPADPDTEKWLGYDKRIFRALRYAIQEFPETDEYEKLRTFVSKTGSNIWGKVTEERRQTARANGQAGGRKPKR